MCVPWDTDRICIVTDIGKIVRQFISVDVRNALASTKGVKGIILVTCGSSVTNEKHFEDVKGLVTR
jgi:hypothetical protein